MNQKFKVIFQLHRALQPNLGYRRPYPTKKEVIVEQELFGEK